MSDAGATHFEVPNETCPICESKLHSDGREIWCTLYECPYMRRAR